MSDKTPTPTDTLKTLATALKDAKPIADAAALARAAASIMGKK